MRSSLLFVSLLVTSACLDPPITDDEGEAGNATVAGSTAEGGGPDSGGSVSTGGSAVGNGGKGGTTGKGGSGGTNAAAGGSSASTNTGGTGTGGTDAGAGGEGAGTGGTDAGAGGDDAGSGATSGTGGSAAGSGGTSGTSSAGTGGSAGAGGSAGSAGGDNGMEWLPSWATSIQRTEMNANYPPPLPSKTLRQFVWPTVSGSQIRVQLSNEKGTTPVQIQKVAIAKANGTTGGRIQAATSAAFTFGGMSSVTIPAGQTVWSDALTFDLVKIELTTVSMQFGTQVPTEITGHPGARTMSYIGAGGVDAETLTSPQTRERWYFINAIEVMAPADAFAIAALGDSITDGYGLTLFRFERWTDFFTLRIQDDPLLADKRSVLNFGMGANSLTRPNGSDQDAGVVRFERDVLKRDKIKWLIVMEGVNDINGGVQSQPIIDAYEQIITKCREKGIKIYGSPITPMNAANAVRTSVNSWVRTTPAGSGGFDALVDFDSAIRDPNNLDYMLSTYRNDTLHPSIAGYAAMADTIDLSLFH